MILLVTGTRRSLSLENKHRMEKSIHAARERWGGIEHLFVGDATGVDAYAVELLSGEAQVHVFKADWDAKGKTAGPLRNREMVKAALEHSGRELRALAFPHRASHAGTVDCMRALIEAGVPLSVVPLL